MQVQHPRPYGERASQPLLVSADSHVVEPPDVFAAVARRFGFDAPRLIETTEKGLVLETGFAGSYQPGRFATAGLAPHSPEYQEQKRSGYARAALSDVSGRLSDMDADRVGAEIVFPSLIARCLSKQALDGDVVQALTASYNDWVADYCSSARGRLFPIACLPSHDLEAALRELERVKRAGHVGVLLPSSAPGDRPYSDAAYDHLWATA